MEQEKTEQKTEVWEEASDSEVLTVSDAILERNHAVYEELAK